MSKHSSDTQCMFLLRKPNNSPSIIPLSSALGILKNVIFLEKIRLDLMQEMLSLIFS